MQGTKEVHLKDGIRLTVREDYIGQVIQNTKDYYERELLGYFIDHLPVQGVIYDVGANIGNHSVFFAKYLKARKVYAFEPGKELFDLVSRNMENNHLQQVEAFHLAAGAAHAKAAFLLNENNSGASTVQLDEAGAVTVIPLDEFPGDRPDFVKIDVEGHEYEVIQGMQELLASAHPVLWVEIFPQHFQKVDDALSGLGYAITDSYMDNYIYVKIDHHKSLPEIVRILTHVTLKRYTSRIHETNIKYRDITTSMQKQKTELQSVQKQLQEADKANQALQQELKLLQKERDLLVGQIAGLDKWQDRYRNTLEEEIHHLRKRYEAAVRQSEELEASLEKLQQENRQAAKAHMLELQKQQHGTVQQQEELRKKHHEAVQQNEELRKRHHEQYQELRQKHEQAAEAHAREQERVAALEEQLLETAGQQGILEQELQELRIQHEQLQVELQNEIIEKLRILEKEEQFVVNLEPHFVQAEQAEFEKKQLQEECTRLNMKHKDLQKQYDGLQQRYKQLQKKQEKTEQVMQKKCEASEKSHAALEKKYKALEKKYEVLEKKQTASQKKYEALEQRYEAIRSSKLGRLTANYWSLRNKMKK